MTRKLHARMLALTAALWAGAGAAFADTAASATWRLQAAGGEIQYSHDGSPRFVGAIEPGAPIPLSTPPQARTPEGFARAAMADYGAVFGITDPERQLKTKRVSQRGQHSSTRFQQLHNGVPVIGGELVVNMRGEAVTAMNGESAPNLTLDTTPAVDAGTARETALALTAKWHREEPSRLAVSEPELSVYVPSLIGPGDGKGRLVWRMEVTSTVGGPIRELLLVDALNGTIALHFNQIDTARNRLTYDANGSNTEVYTAHTLRCDEANDTCTGGDADEVAAHTYAKNTYDFFSTHHGRDSIDGAGMSLISVVHSTAPTCPNAYWNGVQMTYCNGLPQGDDVVAHELTHGVTEYTSGLYYYYQSGAINESMSDVFGEFVDQTNGSVNDTADNKWLIGEEVGYLWSQAALRSMKDPETYGHPDKMSSTSYYLGDLDNGGVHSNSGVNNKAVYLMTDGGTFNGLTITGIGRNKVAAIYYKVQDDHLTPGADYYDLYLALQQACAALVGGAEGITSANCTQVKNAALAVEMNKQPATDFRQRNAPLCPSGQPTSVVFSDDFESGYANWLELGGVWTGSEYFSDALYAYSDVIADATAFNADPITVPAGGYLWFSHLHNFEATSVYYDGGVLEYSADRTTWTEIPASLIDAGATYEGTIDSRWSNPLAGRSAFVGDSHGFASTRVNLSKFAGNPVFFRWRFGADDGNGSYWLIDDIKVYSCNPTDRKAPTVAATLPANAATAIPRNSSVTVRFSEPMKCSTVTASRFTLKNGTTPVTGTVTCSGNAATFNPSANLGASKKYTATVTSAVTDLAGNRMAANKVWSFTAGTTTDTTRPTVPTVSPANGSTGNSTLKTVTATFSENLDCATVKPASVKLLEGVTSLSPKITCSGKTVSIGPLVLKSSTTYTVTLGTTITDLAGNALAAPKTWSFQTAGGMAFAP